MGMGHDDCAREKNEHERTFLLQSARWNDPYPAPPPPPRRTTPREERVNLCPLRCFLFPAAICSRVTRLNFIPDTDE